MIETLQDRHGWTGKYKAFIFEGDFLKGDAELVDIIEEHNSVTYDGRDLLVSGFAGIDSKTKMMAWGTSNANITAPEVLTQAALKAESGRKGITNYNAGAAHSGQYVTRCYLAPEDANVHILELGWFGGANASATAGSGVMIARAVFDFTKTSANSLIIERTDTIA